MYLISKLSFLVLSASLAFSISSHANSNLQFSEAELNGPCGLQYQNLSQAHNELNLIERGLDPIVMDDSSGNYFKERFMELQCFQVLKMPPDNPRPHFQRVETCQGLRGLISNEHAEQRPQRIESQQVLITELNKRLSSCVVSNMRVSPEVHNDTFDSYDTGDSVQ